MKEISEFFEEEMFNFLENVLKEKSKGKGTVLIFDKKNKKDYLLPCNHNYNIKSNNVFSFCMNRNAEWNWENYRNFNICNQQSATYSYSDKYEYNGKRAKTTIQLDGTIKSVYIYKNETNFAIVPNEIAVYIDDELKMRCPYQKYEEYLAEKI